jgi:hypothetical protein
MENNSTDQLSPEKILQMGTAFWPSKILLTAVHFQLFTFLAERVKMSGPQIKQMLNLNCTDRNVYDFLDALTVLGFLDREGLLESAQYSNHPDADFFLDKSKPSYIGGLLEMLNNRLYRFWGDLENGLRTGLPQNEIKDGAEHPFTELYKSPEKLSEFVNAMSGIQMGNFMALAQKFNFSKYKTLVDAGGASALLSIMVAKQHPHMICTSLDLPPVEPIALLNIKQYQLTDRVTPASLDFFAQPLPASDVVVMGNILHDWNEEKKITLMKKAYDALPSGGAFIAIENIIDDERKSNLFGLLMSLNMLIETGKGFDYTFSDFEKWAKTVGFSRTEKLPLVGPASAAIAYK